MPRERTPFAKIRAVLLITCLFLSAVAGPLAGPVAVDGVAAQTESATLVAGNVSADPGNAVTLDVTYDVSSEDVEAENLVVEAYDFRSMSQVGNTDTLTDLSDSATVDVDVSDTPGDYRLYVEIKEEGSDSPITSDSATVDVTSPVGVTDFAAPDAANTGEQIELDVDVENTDSQTTDVRLQSYVDESPSPMRSKTYSAPDGQSRTTLQSDIPDHLRPGPHDLTVNDRGTETVMISNRTVDFSGLSVTTGDGTVTANATVTNEMDAERDVYVPLYVDGEAFGGKSVTFGAGESREVSVSASVSAGDYRVGVGDLSPESVTVESGGGSSGDDTPNYDVIKGVDVSHTGVGNAPSQDPTLRVSDPYDNVLMGAEVRPPSGGLDLADAGADGSTEFEVELKVHEDHEPMMLLGTAQNVTWTKEPIEGSNYYDVTVTASPMAAQYVSDPPREWGTDESTYYTAESAYDAMLDISFVTNDTLSNDDLDGATIATDAQSVGTPLYDERSNSLGLYVAGPHYATDGSVNTGEYEAFLPDGVLDAWGVDDPTEELQANYGDQQYDSNTADFEVTDDGVAGGALVEFPIHYSDGTVSVSPTDAGSGGASSSSPPAQISPSDAEGVDATTTEPDATTGAETTTEPETTSEPGASTATTSASPTTTATPETALTETATEPGESTTEESSNAGGAPGFGPATAAVALVAGALVALRRSH